VTINAIDVPRDAGRLRPASRIEPGWWVHLFDDNGDPPGAWYRVVGNDFHDGRRTLTFSDGSTHGCTYNCDAVSLTDVESARHNLREANR
jgi:hypothetical protein